MVVRGLAKLGSKIPTWLYSNRFTKPFVRTTGPYVASAAASLADAVFYDETSHTLVYDPEESAGHVAGLVKGVMWIFLIAPLWYGSIILWSLGVDAARPGVGVGITVASLLALGLAKWVDDIEVSPLVENRTDETVAFDGGEEVE